MRVMAIDYGDAHTGVALSDPTGFLVGTTATINSRRQEAVVDQLVRLIEEHRPDEVVLGFPKNMNNTVGDRAEKSLAFKEMLERRTGLPVVMWDERLTTVEANRTLMEGKVRREDRKQYVDKLAAVFILQGYLDCEGMKSGNTHPDITG